MPRSYMAVALASFSLIAGAAMPTPLYQIYGDLFRFSPFTLTAIFGAYALGVIPALLVFGPVGDVICRRRVLMAAICIEALGIGLLAAAQSVLWLFAGRVLVGVAVGASQGNLSAALVEMQPQGDRRRAALMTTASTVGGGAAGPLISGLMGQYLPDPLLLCYFVEIGLLAVAMVLVAGIDEAAGLGTLNSLRIHRPRVPRGCARRFVSAGFSGGLSWSIGGLFVALVPSYVSGLLHRESLAAGGTLVALMLGASVAGQLSMGRQPAARLQVLGLGGAVAGLAGVVFAWPHASLPLMFAGSVVCGACTGMAYLGSISELNRMATSEERGSVNSLYFMIVYLFFTVPTIALGFAATCIGLYPAVCIFSVIVAILSVAEIVWLVTR